MTLGSTMQSLMALVNGDEIYVTFSAVEDEQTTARIFNVAFISFFIFLFTIIALNIFIAIFNTTYEEIQVTNICLFLPFFNRNTKALLSKYEE